MDSAEFSNITVMSVLQQKVCNRDYPQDLSSVCASFTTLLLRRSFASVAFLCAEVLAKLNQWKHHPVGLTFCYCCIFWVFIQETWFLWLHWDITWASLCRDSLGAMVRWHITQKAWCILPLTKLKSSLLCAINRLKSIKARVSQGSVMGAGIYSVQSTAFISHSAGAERGGSFTYRVTSPKLHKENGSI